MDDLVSIVLNCACFMDTDVSGVCSDDRFVWTKNRGDNSLVGLCAADKEMDFSVGGVAEIANRVRCFFAVRVTSVACGEFKVGFYQSIHYNGVSACAVIVSEMDHNTPLNLFI